MTSIGTHETSNVCSFKNMRYTYHGIKFFLVIFILFYLLVKI